MNKKIIILILLVCFCLTVGSAFAEYKTVKLTTLKHLYGEYQGKDIYVKCRIIPWAQELYVAYEGSEIFLVINKLDDFKPEAQDEVYMKVKPLSDRGLDYLQVIEGKVIVAANKPVFKKGELCIVNSEPFDVLVLKVEKDSNNKYDKYDEYVVWGDPAMKLIKLVGSEVILEGRITESPHSDVADQGIEVVKYKVLEKTTTP
ncbi:MAG: hypothetical protein ABIH00_06525 [Armatimonadota bacterium]